MGSSCYFLKYYCSCYDLVILVYRLIEEKNWSDFTLNSHGTLRTSNKKKDKIDILVPQLLSEGQVHPSTFNIVPQLLFLGQTYPCAIYIA